MTAPMPGPYPPVPPPSNPGRGLRTAGKILSIVGGLILVGAIAVGAIMASSGFGDTFSVLDDGTIVSGSAQVEFDADEDLQVYKEEGAPAPECVVNAPGGADVGSGVSQSSSITNQGRSWTSFGAFTTTVAGPHEITCDGGDVLVAPPVPIGGIFAGVGGILLAVFGGLGGGAMLVIGLILYFVGRSKRKQAQLSQQAQQGVWMNPPYGATNGQ